MKSILFFQFSLQGHALEYIMHLFDWALQDGRHKFIFCIPKDEHTKSLFKAQSENIICVDTNEYDVNWISNQRAKKCLILRRVIKETNATDVILLSYDQYFPFFHFLLPRTVSYVSFLYSIYLYKWESMNFKDKCINVLNYKWLTSNKAVKKILICNGINENIYLNKKFQVNKFINIVDPIAFNVTSDLTKISHHSNITFLHMGALARRKGTIRILKAIDKIPEELKGNYTFIFAGKVSTDIKDEFYSIMRKLQNKVKIITNDSFCTFEELSKYCRNSDYLLMPYFGTSQSSGMLAYASAFNLPVVATNKGMLRKLVQKYNLGYLIDNTEIAILNFIIESNKRQPMSVSKNYIEKNSIENFIKTFCEIYK